MDVTIPAVIADAIHAHTAAAMPREACGLLLGAGVAIADIRACANRAADPRTAFLLDPMTQVGATRDARAGGASVIGCYHSHPSGTPLPSAADARACNAGELWLIVAGRRIVAYHSRIGGALHARFDPAPLRLV